MTARDYKAMAGVVFAELGRTRVTPRQALIYERLVRVTLVVGRQSVRIPRLEWFGRFKLSKGNVCDALHGAQVPGDGGATRKVPGLVELGMLQVVTSPDGGIEVTILPDVTQWRCDWRFTRADDASFLMDLDAVANQVQRELIAQEPGLNEAMAEVSAENALDGHKKAQDAQSVPDSGTAVSDRRQCGDAAQSPVVPSNSFKSSEFSSSKASTKLSTAKLSKVTREQEAALMERCMGLFGHLTMAQWGGAWRNRARQDPKKLDRVLNAVAQDLKEGGVNNAGGHANDLWRRFA